MYRRYAMKFHSKQVEFINCVNMVERVKKARALEFGVANLGVRRYVMSSPARWKTSRFVFKKECS